MYKLCLALAFLAVAAAKPNWPLTYSSYPAVSSVYSPSYSAYGAYAPSAAVYSAPHAYPVVAKTYTAPFAAPVAAPIPAPVPAPAFATAYSYSSPHGVVNPLLAAAPLATVPFTTGAFAAPGYPSAYSAAGVAPVSGYAYGTPFAWKKK